jgi:hypothetical protein
MDVPVNRLAWMDAIWLLARLDGKKPMGLGALCPLYDIRTMAHASNGLLVAA